MKRSSIAFQINLGFGVLVALVVVLGAFSYFSVDRIALSLNTVADHTTTMGKSLTESVMELEALEHSVMTLTKSAQEFETLKDVGAQLQESRKAGAGMSARLSEVNTAFLDQRQTLEKLNDNTKRLVQSVRVSAGSALRMARASDDIQLNLLHAYAGLVNYLNGLAPDISPAIGYIDAASTQLKKTKDLASTVDPRGKSKALVAEIETDMPRYRQYMSDLGQASSAAQRDELKEPLIRYGSKLIKSAEALSLVVRQRVDERTAEVSKIAESIATAAQSAVQSGNAGTQLVENAIGVTLVANTAMGKAVDRLTAALNMVSSSMSQVPQTVRQASASVSALSSSLSGLDKTTALAERSTKTAAVMNGIVVGVCVMAAILGIAIGVIVSRQVVQPLGLFTDGLKQVAQNDLTVQVEHRGASGELAELINGVNKLVRALRQSVIGMRELGDQVLHSAESLGRVTAKTSQSLDEQRSKSEGIAGATQELSASIQGVATSAGAASQTATDAADEGRKGRDVVNRAMDSINVLAGVFRDAGQAMAQLRTKSDDIGVVLEVIQDIAEQTNLLALNASIEAARAGEHGRGFAVVADEVRSLASRTRESTQRIHDLIGALQLGAEDAARAMEDGTAQMEKTVGEAAMVGDALVAINNAVGSINEMNQMIARATEQQTQTANQINTAITSISGLAAQTAIGAQENADAAQHLSSAVRGLRSMVDKFKV